MTTSADFEEFLVRSNLRVTKERQQLYDGVRAQKGHFTVDVLIFRLKESGYAVSRDTVYRNLPLLLEAGVIRQSFRAGRETVYEVNEGKPHHDHILCSECGRVEEFLEPKIEDLQEKVADRLGFELTHHCHQLVGLCKQCRPS